ncbi:uncharacterized protein LOC108602460 [Drosophila busckii]|uniref:uncharacterized protein LOC108602460 n=1 Tax=Drosophila busckii TaxID=30019 RepID=UPI00083F109C|nr:uncharacterized protein LOC108602460 [Drosophila busckii]
MDELTKSMTALKSCRAQGLPICEPVLEEIETKIETPAKRLVLLPPRPIKIIDCNCSATEEEEEEEEQQPEPATADDFPVLEDLLNELAEQRTRVAEIDALLALDTLECPDADACVDMELELNKYNEHPEILQLQRDNNKLRSQLQQLRVSCDATDAMMKHLRAGLCRDLMAAAHMQQRFNQLDSFQRTLEREHALCAQRYRHLQREKYDWVDGQAYISSAEAHAQRQTKRLVHKEDYRQQKREAVQLLTPAKLQCRQIHNYMHISLCKLGNGLRLVPPIIIEFLSSNKRLFCPKHAAPQVLKN